MIIIHLWELLRSAADRIPGVRQFNDWANAKERQARARRLGPLITQMRTAGLHHLANQLGGHEVHQ